MRREGPISVLIVESSPVLRARLSTALQRAGELRAVGASNTAEAREAVLQQHPDVIVLDLDLRRGDALTFLRKLRIHYPVPVFAVTGADQGRGEIALRALDAGALDVMELPALASPDLPAFVADLSERIRDAFAHARPVPPPRVQQPAPPLLWRAAGLDPRGYLVAIGASTGGTEAIRALLGAAPPDFPPTVIVQHMPAGFTHAFAERLNANSPLSVWEARDGESLRPGQAVVARGDTQLELRQQSGGWGVVYTHQQPVNNHCPSVDVLFGSAARHAGRRAIGILLTGMGRDGASGLLELRRAGGLALAQSADSCVVYGMPKAAEQLGAVLATAEPANLPALALNLAEARGSSRKAGAIG
jgi:two-component system chemotaxis response regulator CheB